MSYVYLLIAIVTEIIATTALKATQEFTRLGPSLLVIACVCCSLYCFSVSISKLNVAYVYALWSGVGTACVALLGWRIYGQRLDAAAIIGMILIVAGVAVINLYSQTIAVPE
ncbi:MAG: multidrug efflux SMR transporter [Planctomycetota bacterium]